MDSNGILSLLGLALRGGNLAVGEDAAADAALAMDVRLLLVAADAAPNASRRAGALAQEGQCLWLRIPFTKNELGQALGRSSTAIAAITHTGLANAVAHRLAELDLAQYGEAAQRLDLKAKRASERRAAQLARKKAHRVEKHTPKKEPPENPPKGSGKKPLQKEVSFKSEKNPASRPSKENRPKPRAKPNPYAHSRPVKKGKGSFRKQEV